MNCKVHTSILLILLSVLLFSTTSYCEPSDPITIEENLQAFIDNKLPDNELEIIYTDLHGLWGGLEIIIQGSGKVKQKAVKVEALKAHDLTKLEIDQLVKLLIELKAWQQIVPEREPVPDESRVYLRIKAGNAQSEIWEWFNEIKDNDRLVVILNEIKNLIWKTPALV